jgi:hypothetical protein
MTNQFIIVATGQECYKENEMEEHYRYKQMVEISAISTEVLLLFCRSGKHKNIRKFPVSNACFSGSTSFLYLMFNLIIFFYLSNLKSLL